MNREYHQWFSPTLNRKMELLVFGHAGARMIVFPTSQGRFFDYEDRGMIWALQDHIEQGNLQVYTVDSVDAESFYCSWAHPSGRIQRHVQYDQYITEEVVPFTQGHNANPFLITHGCSFGAYHAVNYGLRHPDLVGRAIGLSGKYDIRNMLDDYYDESVYFNNPVDYVPNEHNPERLQLLQRLDIIIAIGDQDPHYQNNRDLSNALWSKGIWHALRVWDGWAHDWPYWQQMIRWYVGGA
jgi:esterase/lipase superfamily enzyme